MISDLFVLTENELAPLLFASIKDVMPDVRLTYITPPGLDAEGWPAVAVESLDTDVIGKALRKAGYTGVCFILPSSALVLRDFRPSLPPADDLAKFYSGDTRQCMCADEHSHAKQYEDLGVDFNAGCNRVRFINLGLLDQPQAARRTIRMSLKMRYGADPLVTDVLDGLKLVEFSRDALKAHIIDFGRELLDAATTVDECYAYPFDAYARYAARVKCWLPPATYAAIKRNARRTRTASRMRNLLV